MIVPWQSTFELGLGYSTEQNASRTRGIEILGHNPHQPAAEVQTSWFLVASSEQYAHLIRASSSAGLLIGGLGSAEASFDLSRELAISKNTVHAVVLTTHQSALQRGEGANLTQYAKHKLQTEGPEAFQGVFGDRYIASRSIGGRFAGIYTMAFRSEERCVAARARVAASGAGAGAGADFKAIREEFQDQFRSSSSILAYGWPQSQLPACKTPQELWDAAQGMDATQGSPISALLCPYTDLPDYREALDQYKKSQRLSLRSWLSWLFGRPLPAWSAPGYETDAAIEEARKRVGLEYTKLQYLEKLIAAEMEGGEYDAGLDTLESLVTSLRVTMSSTFQERTNLSALARRLQYHEAPAAGTAAAEQWNKGQELKERFFRARILEQSVRMLLYKKEQESGWLGSLSDGVLQRVDFDGTQDLVLKCVVPSAVNADFSFICGRFAISHIQGAADQPLWDLLYRSSRYAMRFATSVYMPLLAAGMVAKRNRDVLHGAWSATDVLTQSGLRDVKRVEVLQGVTKMERVAGVKVVLQVTFHLSDDSVVKIPNCPNYALFETSERATVVVPPVGQNGRVVAVSGLGHALNFHWVPSA